MKWIETWRSSIASVVGIVALVGGGLLWFDGRYTLVSEFIQLAEAEQRDSAGTRAMIHQGRLSTLEEQKFRLEMAAEARKLTVLERERLSAVNAEIMQLRRVIEQLEQKAAQ